MANYQILVKNKSGASRAYFLFVESPEVSAGVAVYQNVYIASSSVPSGTGNASFNIRKDLYAVTGTNPGQKLGSNVTVTTGDYGVVKLSQKGKAGSNFLMTGAPDGKAASFDPNGLQQDCDQPGNYIIRCAAGTFQKGNGANQFIGLGGQDPADASNIVPVAVFEAQPGTINYIQPRSTYYISWGTYTAGQIIDVKTIATPAPVDFTGKAATLCKIEHKDDGTWDITYN